MEREQEKINWKSEICLILVETYIDMFFLKSLLLFFFWKSQRVGGLDIFGDPQENEVIMFSKTTCPFCSQARLKCCDIVVLTNLRDVEILQYSATCQLNDSALS